MLDRDGITTPTRLTRFDAKAPAILLGTYPKARAASKTLLRVRSETSPRLRKTRLTVISETPAASATSRKVIWGLPSKGLRPRTSGILSSVVWFLLIRRTIPICQAFGFLDRLARHSKFQQKSRHGPVAQLDRAIPS